MGEPRYILYVEIQGFKCLTWNFESQQLLDDIITNLYYLCANSSQNRVYIKIQSIQYTIYTPINFGEASLTLHM